MRNLSHANLAPDFFFLCLSSHSQIAEVGGPEVPVVLLANKVNSCDLFVFVRPVRISVDLGLFVVVRRSSVSPISANVFLSVLTSSVCCFSGESWK